MLFKYNFLGYDKEVYNRRGFDRNGYAFVLKTFDLSKKFFMPIKS